jgi:truncated hemoglobin YjbI
MTDLFTRIGGEATLKRILDLQYERVLADDYLGEYFMGVDIDHVKAMQLAFLRKAFGDNDAIYTGASLHAAHKSQLVTEHAFDSYIDLFVDAARELGVASAEQAEIRAILKSTRARVITEFQPNPAYDYQSKPF